MTKKLLIVRHAKSDWADSYISDFNRPINERGKLNAPIMGKRLLEKGIIPTQIITSPALRALTTAKLIAKELGFAEENIKTNKSIYDASCSDLLKIINRFDQGAELIILVGHNNGISDLAIYLTEIEVFNIPTCGMVLIDFPFDDWKLVSKHTGEVVFFDYPKNND